MSKTKKTMYFCDRCGHEIADAGIKIIPHYFDFETEELLSVLTDTAWGKHFCIDCTMTILEAAEPPGQEAGGKKKKEKPFRRELDVGKVMALYEAGWDYEKIADEIGGGVTARQIYQCIYYQRNKKSVIDGKEGGT